MKTMAAGFVVVALAGCGALLHKVRGEGGQADSSKVDPNARAEIVDGFTRIKDGKQLVWEYATTNVYQDYVNEHGVVFVLSGPGVKQEVAAEDHNLGQLDWDPAWPAGQYSLALLQHGQQLTEQQFTVRKLPRADGGEQPIVALDREPPLRMFHERAMTMIAINVLRPVVSMEFVWIRDHQAVPTLSNDDGTDTVRVDRLRNFGVLGDLVPVRSTVRDDVDLTGATLYLFENGESLLGAWRYVDAKAQPVNLPAITPNPADLAVARKTAAARTQDVLSEVPELAIRVDEPIACAVAQDKEARAAYAKWSDEDIAEQSGTSTQLEKQAKAENAYLTDAQRAQLASDRRQAGRMTVLAGTHRRKAMDVVMSIARKYKKGCLGAMGIPMPRAAKAT